MASRPPIFSSVCVRRAILTPPSSIWTVWTNTQVSIRSWSARSIWRKRKRISKPPSHRGAPRIVIGTLNKLEQSLTAFLGAGDHPRLPEARLQLGKLQMVRATQYMTGDLDDSKRTQARESYLAAAKTFDAMVTELRGETDRNA